MLVLTLGTMFGFCGLQDKQPAKTGYQEDTIPGPSDSIGALKMYVLEKCIFWIQISMLRFLFLMDNLKNFRRNFFMF